jgi:hypothetical protein
MLIGAMLAYFFLKNIWPLCPIVMAKFLFRASAITSSSHFGKTALVVRIVMAGLRPIGVKLTGYAALYIPVMPGAWRTGQPMGHTPQPTTDFTQSTRERHAECAGRIFCLRLIVL